MDPQKQETFQTWDKLADLYWDKFSPLQIYNHSYDRFLALLEDNKNPKILDLCCGPGNISFYLYSKRKDIDLTAVDVSPNMVSKAKEMVPGLIGIVSDTSNINKIDNKFDGIICGFGLPYLNVPEVEKCISDSHHLLKEGGVLYLSFVEGNPEDSGMVTSSTGDRSLFYFHPLSTISSCLKGSGFSEILQDTVLYPVEGKEDQKHNVLICRKKR
jgi:ubiquinone/menaquinone biosynthesis C-methylase UbiE